jgi:hypothetical protein
MLCQKPHCRSLLMSPDQLSTVLAAIIVPVLLISAVDLLRATYAAMAKGGPTLSAVVRRSRRRPTQTFLR